MEKKRLSFFILVAVLVGIIIGILIWRILTPKLGEGVFYYKLDNNKANMFLLNGTGEGEKVITVDAQEVDLGKYKPPKYTFISSDNLQMIYFKKTKEEPINTGDPTLIATRIFFDPILVNLKTGTEKKINQSLDASTLVFSPDSNNIAWIKEVPESTFEEIQKDQIKREIWTSRADGENAQLLIALDDNVVLLKCWSGNYVYFQGVSGVNIKSMGRIDVLNKKVDYLVPQGCDQQLTNCQNIEFSPSGNLFLYEIYSQNNGKDVTKLYLGNLETKESKLIVTTDKISDKAWLGGEKEIVYTNQEAVQGQGIQIKETIHLVDLYKESKTDLYSGNYLSELAFDDSNDYLYFLEKADTSEVNTFNLMRLDVRNKKADKVLTDNYNNILIIQ